MKQALLGVLLFLTVASRALCTDLTPEEVKLITDRATIMGKAYDSGDETVIIEMTHPAIFALTNGKEGYEKLVHATMGSVKKAGASINESTYGTPTQIYMSGDTSVCFIPRVSIISLGSKKMKSTGCLIAAKDAPDGEWKFLDGSALRKHPELLKTFFPKLPDDVKLPEMKMEVLP